MRFIGHLSDSDKGYNEVTKEAAEREFIGS
jgi:hypothetical protein